ncbi:hypothetical protein ACWD6R_03125 [Streptomyces sp. NPDC005151]
MNRSIRTTVLAAVVVTAAALLTACEGTETTAPAVTVTATPSPSETKSEADKALEEAQEHNEKNREDLKASIDAAASEDAASAEKAELPNVVGMDLQAAQDTAQAAGFFLLDDQDASGQGRLQILDRNWTVCSQDPAPGMHPTSGLVTLYAVKDTESC